MPLPQGVNIVTGSEREFDRSAPSPGIANLTCDEAGVAGRDLEIFDIVHVERVADPTEDVEPFATEACAEVGEGIALHVRIA